IQQVSPFSSESSVSKVAPVPAQKIDSKIDSEITAASNSNRAEPSKPKTRDVVCNDIHGELNFHLQCVGNAVVTGATSLVYGGWLEVTGTVTTTGALAFTGPYSLDVWSGKFTVENGDVLLSETDSARKARDTRDGGYHIFVHPGASINLTNADVSGAAEFIVQGFVALPLTEVVIQGVHYHDNEHGLHLMGQGVVVDGSTFYDNNDSGITLDGGSGNVIKNSEFYGTAPGKQSAGIIVKSGGQIIGGNNNIHDNAVGVLLERAGGNQILNNNIHGNVKAGIKSFVPAVVPDFVPPQALYENAKTPVLSSFVSQPGGSMDAVRNPQPNTISGNSITGNGDGIQEYAGVSNNIDSAQAQLIANNNNYGFVGVDEAPRSALENSLGSNGVGKALYLASTSVGAWIYYINGLELPDGPFYVAFCEGDVNCLGATHNDARRYEDYTISYTRQPQSMSAYFTSDLMNTSEIRNILGNATTFTPKFLTRNRSVDNNGNEIRYCEDAAHGFPDACRIRAVTLTRYGDWLGRSSEALHSASYSGNWRPFHIFYDDGVRPNCNWWGALTFAYEKNKDDKWNKQDKQEAEIPLLPQQKGRRSAIKMPLIPEINAVTRPATG
ncbi:MAG: right-handed parallel beta-helix repeat-containing protein, partial [Candidatus Micrarchaeota archaeon]